MAQKTIQGNENLAKQIRDRRNELGLTIEEAATRAGVGTKTWCRYEAGASIRTDKCKGICKALRWLTLPQQEAEDCVLLDVQEYKKHKAWSTFLENAFGDLAALSFAMGSDILLDHIESDLQKLATMPVGSHIGEIGGSCLDGSLPEQFQIRYDYEFLYRMKCALCGMQERAKAGVDMRAHNVLEELILLNCCDEASALIELSGKISGTQDDMEDYSDWVFDLLGDMDIVTFLYSNVYLEEEHPYHFTHWTEAQFYID